MTVIECFKHAGQARIAYVRAYGLAQGAISPAVQTLPPRPAAPPTALQSEVPHPIPTPRPLYRAYGSCDSGHSVDAVLDDGHLVKLEDGSLWEVDAADQIDTALWLPMSEITVCVGKLINTDDNETADAVQIN
jgi:hypothetical protein